MAAWTVQPHGAWRELAPGLWSIRGSLSGMPLPRYFVVARIGGDLLLHSVACLEPPAMAELESWGRPRWMVVPNQGHRLDAPAYKARYPEIQVIAPRTARPHVAQKVSVDADAEDALPPLGIRIHRPDGMLEGYELVYELDLAGGGKALLVNDILSDPARATGLSGWFVGLVGPPGGQFGQPRIVRWRFGKDRAAFRGFVERLAAIEDVRVITMSHAPAITERCSEVLRDSLPRL